MTNFKSVRFLLLSKNSKIHVDKALVVNTLNIKKTYDLQNVRNVYQHLLAIQLELLHNKEEVDFLIGADVP